jgi:hypothetical protein
MKVGIVRHCRRETGTHAWFHEGGLTRLATAGGMLPARTTVDRLVRRLIADSLQELEDYEAVKAFRARPGRTAELADVKKRL